ncbi:hypothetical protein PC9H_004454 [Pleurotus ostreatus]|uniref:Uncharacterized protein n=1 Tax=Pleurotus ostreatus TaxID=5322 RepID=A0A8H6ZYY0_PLEOS|nr:uncharacterized protein PC9H_004454 [Pleurotus ostreatus]KAF7432513.1 hypothetical protein PC9H_004454 [Pleurotus ostreatus]
MSTFYMPEPGQRHAPSFSGDPGSLERFFDEFKLYAVTANLDGSTKNMVHPNDWKAFKNAIYDEYPGSRISEFTSLSELEELITQYRNQITTAAQLGKYRRRFTDICKTLQETSTLSECEVIQQFLSAFPDDMQATIDPILRILAPEKPRHEVYDLDTIYHAVLHTYNGRSTFSTQDNRMITAPASAEEIQCDVSITNSPVPAATSAAQSPMNTRPTESALTTADTVTAKQTRNLGSHPAVNSQDPGTTQPTTITTRLSTIPEPHEQLEAIPSVNSCAAQDRSPPRPVPSDKNHSDDEATMESNCELDTDNLPLPAPEPPDSEDKSNDDETAIPVPHKLDGTLSLPRTISAPHTTTAVARRNEALEIRHEVYRQRHREGIGTQNEELGPSISQGDRRQRHQLSSLRLARQHARRYSRRRQRLRKRCPPERTHSGYNYDS